MEKAYEPRKFEDKIYKNWEEKGLFNPDKVKELRKVGDSSFSIILPPPNVTGTLHLGHAAMLAIEDLMIRYHRMKGFDTAWIPGTDHAAIATQNVVEKRIYKEQNKTRHDLGREKFLAEIEKFVEQSKDTIHKQIRKMGSSLDWSREAYTLDETRSKAVRKVFKMMYDDGLIYRGYRIVNWCPRCQSTLSDDEVDYKNETAKLYYFKYNKDFPFTIATTRPETKLGDSAVAVNPEDKRYKKYIGKTFDVDFVGVPLKLKIIADKEVDPEFGTGALGVTPAHSMVDYEMAQKNDLEIIKVIDEDGKITDKGGPFAGQSNQIARDEVVKKLKDQGLLEKVEDVEHKLSICYRCDTPIEPLPSEQWFVNVNKKVTRLGGKSLKEKAIEVVKDSSIEIIPDRFKKIYLNWMGNLHDWCISRQIWFGHQIPVWYQYFDPAIKITFFRHGESEANAKRIAGGHDDTPLTEKGRKQITELSKKIDVNKYDGIFCSDFSRAKETAEILFKDSHLQINTDERLREVDFGDLTGKPTKKLDEFREDGFPGGESYYDVRQRLELFLIDIGKKYKGKHIAIASHSGIWKTLENLINKQPMTLGLLKQHAPRDGVEYSVNKVKYVGEEAPEGEGWQQDPDTLDTWFSSGLWTFTTLLDKDFENFDKDKNADLKRFHPTSVLETAYDILFFWVARMILMTNYVMGEIPFEKVYFHGLIRDKEGDKMSKSKPETAIDPIEVGDKYGYDAVRLSMLIGSTPGNDFRLYDEKIAGFRNFVNKLWNISRFVLKTVADPAIETKKIKARTDADKWILSRFNQTVKDVTKDLDNYQFSAAGEKLRDFTWNEFADWYLEISKIEKGKDQILMHILKNLLRMWHPFVPFVTEAIWENLNQKQELMISQWPEFNKKLIDEKDEKKFEKIKEVITAIRNLRAENKVEPAKLIKAQFIAKKKFKDNEEIIKALAKLEAIEYVDSADKPAASSVVEDVEIYLPLAGLIDIGKEKSRLEKEIQNIKKYVDAQEKKLGNEEFTKNAPGAVVEVEKKKLEEAKEKFGKLQQQLEGLK